MKRAKTHLLLLLVAASVVVSTQFAAAQEAANRDPALLRVYRLADYPVWNSKGEFKPDILIALIQQATGPNTWKRNGGESVIKPDNQNHAVIVSAKRRQHDEIVKLLKSFRDGEASVDDAASDATSAGLSAAEKEHAARLQEYQRGLAPVSVVIRANQRLLDAELAMQSATAKRDYRERAMAIAQFAKLNLEAGTGTKHELALAVAEYLKARTPSRE